MVSRLCDDGVQGRDGRCVENSSCFQIFLFVPVCILLLGSAAGLICFPLIFTCLPVLFICLPALDCCGRLCLAILCLPALDVAGSSCRVFRFEKHKLFGVYGGVICLLVRWIGSVLSVPIGSCTFVAVATSAACKETSPIQRLKKSKNLPLCTALALRRSVYRPLFTLLESKLS